MAPETDVEGDVGPIDDVALDQIRSVFGRADGLVERSGFDSRLDPTRLEVRLADGIDGADWCRFDIRWFQRGYYSFHHVDEQDTNFRYDYHPKPDAPEKHFHRPPDAGSDDIERSCITATDPMIVARAVHGLWRRAYEANSLSHLNTAENTP